MIQRVDKEIVTYINVHRVTDKLYFKTYIIILEILEDIYEKYNREKKTNHEYHHLRMSLDIFNVFYSKLIKNNRILKYSNSQLMFDLKRKIISKLQDILIIKDFRFTSLSKMKEILQIVDIKQRNLIYNRERQSVRASISSVSSNRSTSSFRSTETDYRSAVLFRSTSTPTSSTSDSYRSEDNRSNSSSNALSQQTYSSRCHECGKIDHLIRDYSDNKQTFNIHEVYMNSEEIERKIYEKKSDHSKEKSLSKNA